MFKRNIYQITRNGQISYKDILSTHVEGIIKCQKQVPDIKPTEVYKELIEGKDYKLLSQEAEDCFIIGIGDKAYYVSSAIETSSTDSISYGTYCK